MNSNKPSLIRFTGVDDANAPAGMVALSNLYPPECGVLF